MALTSSFSFTNTSENSHTVTPVVLGPVTNYALLSDEPSECVLSNKTCKLDRGELLTFQMRDLKTVNTALTVPYPAPVSAGVQYTVKLEELLTTVSSVNEEFRLDEPITVTLSIKHGKSGNITTGIVAQVVQRLLGALMKADGSFRFDDLMRSSLKPTVD